MYYGEQKVEKTLKDKIILENGQEITLNEKEQKVVLSKEPLEIGKFTYQKANKISGDILDLLEGYENIFKKSDLQYVLEFLVSSMKGNYETAVAKALNIYDEETVKKYGTNKILEDVTLKELKKFL